MTPIKKQSSHKQGKVSSSQEIRDRDDRLLKWIPIGIATGMLIILALSYLLFAATSSAWVIWLCGMLFFISLLPLVHNFIKSKKTA